MRARVSICYQVEDSWTGVILASFAHDGEKESFEFARAFAHCEQRKSRNAVPRFLVRRAHIVGGSAV